MPATLKFKNPQALRKIFADLPDRVSSGVKVIGEAVDYALVWEWGSIRLHKPGPKTTWGTNPAGARVVLTITAPTGYIRTNTEQYHNILRDEFSKLQLATVPINQWRERIEDMMKAAADRCRDVIRDAAPEDTGQLKASLIPVYPGEEILQTGTYNAFGSTALELEL